MHVKDPVVHVRVGWIMETLKHPACEHKLGSATVTAGFPQGKKPEYPSGKILEGQFSCKKKKKDFFLIRLELWDITSMVQQHADTNFTCLQM